MSFFVYYNYKGQIKMVRELFVEPLDGLGWIEVPGEYSPELMHKTQVIDGQLVALPPQPTIFHQWNPDEQAWWADPETLWRWVRQERDERLKVCDWVALRAADTGLPMDSAWKDYRQSLRDITNQPNPANIVWPTPPVD
jgi:hypothetical protein